MRRFVWLAVVAVLAAISHGVAAPARQVIVVPASYHAKTQPPVAVQSYMLTLMQQGGSWDDKYHHAVAVLAKDRHLMASLKKAARTFGVDPVDIAGAIVGEHTFNMNVFDTLQDYYVKALQYLSNRTLTFEYQGELAKDFLKRPQFAACEAMKDAYDKWDCRETVWNRKFMGRIVDGRSYPIDRLNRVFFMPMYAGQTFGVGQIGPIVALSVTDLVHRKAGLPLLSIDNPSQVFEQIMNPDTSMTYIAASIRMSIDRYREIAGFDISQNPGIVATLYNLGDAATRAGELRATNAERARKGLPPQFPQENFYGWFVNEKADELRKLVEGKLKTAWLP